MSAAGAPGVKTVAHGDPTRSFSLPLSPPRPTHGAHTTHTALPVYLYPGVDIPAIAFW